MIRRIVGIAAALMLASFTADMLAQTKPNFTGKWVKDDPGGAWGRNATITQDATTLTVEFPTVDRLTKLIYLLDGTESKNRVELPGGPMTPATIVMPLISTAVWEGDRLILTDRGEVIENRLTLSFAGETLVVQMQGQGKPPGREPLVVAPREVRYRRE